MLLLYNKKTHTLLLDIYGLFSIFEVWEITMFTVHYSNFETKQGGGGASQHWSRLSWGGCLLLDHQLELLADHRNHRNHAPAPNDEGGMEYAGGFVVARRICRFSKLTPHAQNGMISSRKVSKSLGRYFNPPFAPCSSSPWSLSSPCRSFVIWVCCVPSSLSSLIDH